MEKLILYDIDTNLCNEWKKQFKDYPNVKIVNCDFKKLRANYVVTAGNSYAWMTGGIDLAVREYYGQEIQDTLQSIILALPGRYLPVGQSICIETKDKLKPYLIYAPTMPLPVKIDGLEVFYVFAKLLKIYRFQSIACCGLGTSTGGISIEECAKQMRLAYEYVLKEEKENEEKGE